MAITYSSSLPCLLFDCDGTLVDSESLSNQALVTMFRRLLRVDIDEPNLAQRCRGIQFTLLLDDFCRQHDVILPDDFIPRYRAYVGQLFNQHLRAIDGVPQMLTALSDYPKAVVSNGPQAKMQQTLGQAGIRDHFAEQLYSAFDIDCFKPAPGLYLHAAKMMGFKPSDCIVIDDGMVGVEAGLSAGMTTFYYNPHNGPKATTQAIEFTDMLALPELINDVYLLR